MVIGIGIAAGGWFMNYFLNAPEKNIQAVTEVQTKLTQEILDRSVAYTKLSEQFKGVDSKLDTIIKGLGLKYSLPKDENLASSNKPSN